MNIKISDIIKAALDLADLTNSSMPTADENKFWINTAFSRVYQKAINMGEKYYFTKKSYPEEGSEISNEYDLPENFYQLYDIRYGENSQIIRRYQKWMTNNDTWYDIRGDKLVLSKSMGVDIYYFDNPITMDISVADTSLDFPNHIFYQLCVIYLAEYYKIKQGADVSALEMMKEEAWNTYYDVLTRDVNQPLIIQDSYRHVNFFNGTGGING